MVTFDAVSAAERLVRERFPEARAAWRGGSAATGSMTPMSDLDITVLLSSKPAPFRESLIVEGRPVELFVHTEDSLWFFCAQDRRRRRPTMLRLIGTSIVIVDVDGAGKRLQDQFHRLDQEGPSALTPEEVEAARYVVTDLLDDLRADGPEVLSVAATLFRETAELVLGANARWSGAGKWLLRELRAFDADQATNHADALSHGLAAVGSGDIAPMQNATNAALTAVGGRLFDGYRGTRSGESNPPPGTEKALMAAELELMSGVLWRDEQRIRDLLHPDFLEIGRSGKLWTRSDIIAVLAKDQDRTPPDTDEWRFTPLTSDLVLLTYRTTRDNTESRHSSIWDISGVQPTMRFHQGTLVSRL